MTKHFKNLRFSPKKTGGNIGYLNFKNQPIFSLLFNKRKYQFLLAEVLIFVIRDLNAADKRTDSILRRKLSRKVIRLEADSEYYIDNDVTLSPYLQEKIISEISKIYSGTEEEIARFHGDILEYYILYIEKYRFPKWRKTLDQFKLYYECYPQYKRKSKEQFFSNNFNGIGCDVDLLKSEKYGEYINLIECKFSLEGTINRMSQRFQKKINYMNNLANELRQYKNHYGTYIDVRKQLASFSDCAIELPSNIIGHDDYEILNVHSELIKVIDQYYEEPQV